MRVGIIVGTRPNYIKALPIVTELLRQGHIPIVINTGQHYDYMLSGGILENIKLQIDHHLQVNNSNRDNIQEALFSLIREIKLDWVILFGDVNSTLAGAMAAKKNGVPIAHVESGLRSNDWRMEEEYNRYLTDSLSDVLFTTEESGIINILTEFGLRKPIIEAGLVNIEAVDIVLTNQIKDVEDYGVCTIHRRENLDERTLRILEHTLSVIDGKIELYAHPHLKQMLKTHNVHLPRVMNAIPYEQFLKRVKNALFVLTDSGGVEIDAAYLRTPCVVFRNTHEHRFLDSVVKLSQDPYEIQRFVEESNGIAPAVEWAKGASKIIVDWITKNGQHLQ